MKKHGLTQLLLAAAAAQLGVGSLCAQTNSDPGGNSFFYQGNPVEITPEAGTTGLGASANFRFANHFGIRTGFDYFHYSLTRTEQSAQYKGTLRLQSEPTAVDLYPSRHSSFHLSLGILWNQQQLTGSAVPSSGSITLNGNKYSLSGASVNLKVNQPSVMPYAGIGGDFFYFDSGHHVSFGGELGAAYGKWTTSLTENGVADPTHTLQNDINTEQGKINHTLNKVPVWPILKLGIGISF
jgi:hypothetical protein